MVANTVTWIAASAPRRNSVTSGTTASRKAQVYHFLRPTLSMFSAQITDAMTPTAEVIQP